VPKLHAIRIVLMAAAISLSGSAAFAEIPGNKIKVGVLTDMSGFASDTTGEGSVNAARLAIEDFKKENPAVEVDLISADHQNKPDVGSAIARRWMDQEGVDAILDVPVSSVALAVQELVRNSKVAFIASGAGTADLTGTKCSPNFVHWTYDTWSLANGTATALIKAGKKSWFFITADYAFGHALEADAARVIEKNGGTVVGKVRHPTSQPDFSSYLLQAQASKAQVIALANSAGDAINSIKQANEFGITSSGQSIAAMILQDTDVHVIGLKEAQGLYLTAGFYWDMNDGTRAFADRYAALMKGRRPVAIQAGVYSGLLHYLRAAVAANSTDGRTVVAKMKEMPSKDPLFGEGHVREDGRTLHDMYLFQVKSPAESKREWDYFKLVQTIPAAEAFRPLSEGGCPLVAK
jgi:branched-chain amino acid transport system substrate-binding protein